MASRELLKFEAGGGGDHELSYGMCTKCPWE